MRVFFLIVTGTDFDSCKQSTTVTNLKHVTIDTQNNRYGPIPSHPLQSFNPLQCSCLEGPRDGGAWWADIYGVAQSRIRLKRLSSSSSSSSDSKESACNAGDAGSIPGSGRSPGVGNSNPFQYSCLENSTYRGACRAIVHGVTKRQTQLSN